MKNRHLPAMLIALVLIAWSPAVTSAQDSTDTPVNLVFQNTTEQPVDVYWVLETATGTQTEQLYINQLAAGFEQEQPAFANQLWRIKQNGTAIADYDAAATARQEVDIANLVAWQSEVKLVFQNTTQAAVSVVWIDAEAEEIPYNESLAAGMEYSQPALPGQQWRIYQGTKVLGDYIADAESEQYVDLKLLAEQASPMVEVVFQNTTQQPVDVTWVDADGSELVYAPNLPQGQQHRQAAYPLQLWRVRDRDGELLAEVYIGDAATQPVDLKQLVTAFRQQPGGGQAGGDTTTSSSSNLPPRPPRPGK